MTATAELVTLPNGYWVKGEYYRQAELRMLTGADEEFMAESTGTMLPAEWSHVILSRCITRLTGIDAVTPQVVSSLTIGDREALLLHLRRLTFGNRIQCTLTCPKPNCGELLDLELNVSDLLQPPNPDPSPVYEFKVEKDGSLSRIFFHLPTGQDQEKTIQTAHIDIDKAAEILLKHCIEKIIDEEDNPIQYSTDLLKDLPARMAELDPQAELVITSKCPSCNASIFSIFDTGYYFMNEAAGDLESLYREVHTLALYYHWNESEILEMKTAKRRRYLKLLQDSISITRE